MSEPRFAVVGHPNKGKSSIVATLSCDDSVRIGDMPGTTAHCRSFPMAIDGKACYELVDTPGFQRARRVLQWLREHETSAAEHPAVVRQFVAEFATSGKYPDECELLKPLLEGAAILYVVDGSVPYSSEYEAEMEILRWSGQPSMALINPIRESTHIESWETALGQFFRVVRVFNPMTAVFAKRVDLLETFGQLHEPWRASLKDAVTALHADREERMERSGTLIATMIADMLTLTAEEKLAPDREATDGDREALEERYRGKLRRLEQDTRRAVQQLYHHHSLERQDEEFKMLAEDLFSESTWNRFGLDRATLFKTGTMGGAATGGAIDVAVGGASFLVGSLIGAAVGGGLAWFAGNKLAKLKVLNIPLGGRKLVYGPMSNENFPFVVMGRARLHHRVVAGRPHARRDELMLGEEPELSLSSEARKALAGMFQALRKDNDATMAMREIACELRSLISGDCEEAS
ncbi:MAG: hypothetical protein ACI8W8_000066 [Rhodothermales bacterium]|jgi:hypothetical protein